MEQVGEKQDFESELTRYGMRHEDFMLRVRRPVATAHDDAWNQDYIVAVYAVSSGRRHHYNGGPRQNWVAQFVIDLAQGMYGHPPDESPAGNGPVIARPRAGRQQRSPFQRRAN
jgi:hypothetical protein